MSDRKIEAALRDVDASRTLKPGAAQNPELWALLNGIHGVPVLRDWVTLESRGLHPKIFSKQHSQRQRDAIVAMLLSCTRRPGGKVEVSQPWACAAWNWPSGRLIFLQEIPSDELADDLVVNESDLCNADICHRVEEALREGRAVPQPRQEIDAIYDRVLPTQLCSLSRQHEATDTSSSPSRGGWSQSPSSTEDAAIDSGRQLPPDTSQHTLHALEQLIARLHEPDLEDAMRRIGERHRAHRYSVAIVGERQRGKSTLINSLLGASVLPTGMTPTTRVPTRLLDGARMMATVHAHDGSQTQLPSADAVTLAITTDAQTSGGAIRTVHIRCPNQWLRDSSIELIDFPGIDGPAEDTMAITTDAIACCDASLLICAATMPLGLLEQAIIQQDRAPGSRTAVVLTRLDQVKENERANVMQHVADSIRALGVECPVLCVGQAGLPARTTAPFVLVLDEIRQLLSSWAQESSQGHFRSLVLHASVDDLLDRAAERIEYRHELLRGSGGETSRMEEVEQEIIEQRSAWLELGNELLTREQSLASWFDERIRSHGPELIEDLNYELARSPDAKQWWDRDLPYRLRKTMQAVSGRLSPSLQQRFDADCKWLGMRMTSLTRSTQAALEGDASLSLKPPSTPGPEELVDLAKVRLLSRLGCGVGTAVAFILAGPLGMIAGAGGLALSETLQIHLGQGQKTRAASELDAVVSRALQMAADSVRDRVSELYSRLSGAVRDRELAWAESKRAEADSVPPDKQQSLVELEGLLGEISDFRRVAGRHRKETADA